MKNIGAVFWVFLCMQYIICDQVEQNEFIQPRKQKRVSIHTLKEKNVAACSDAFETTFSLVERLGRMQTKLKNCLDKVIEEDTKKYQEQAQQDLAKIKELLSQMEDLLATCEKCI